MSEIKIPTEELRALMGKAILDGLSQSTREQLIAGALEYLLTRPDRPNSYRGETDDSPLEAAFQRAVRDLGDEVAREVVAEMKPQVAAELRQMIDGMPSLADNWDLQRKLMAVLLTAANDKVEERYR